VKIKTKLELVIICNILILAGIVSVSLLWQKQAGKQWKQQALVMELNQAIFERARLREEYFIYREERSKEQFMLLHKRITGLLERMSGTFTGLEEKASLLKMMGFHNKIEGFFNQLVRLDQSAMVLTATAPALRERIISQMLMNAHSIHDEGLRLLNAANEKTVYQNHLYFLCSTIVFGLLALFIVTLAVIILRSITRPLTRLHKGTEIIAEGNLNYKTNIRTPDEIGQLSTAFDAMTENLKKITVSRDELNKDIEERERAEGVLRESEARFKQFFDSINDGISVRDAQTFELVDANRRFCEMYGYTLEELKALPLGSLAGNESPEERRRRLGFYYAEVAEGVLKLFEAEGTRKDGSTFWVEVNVRRITIGGRECVLSVARDITERKDAEEAMKRSEEAALRLAQETGVIAEVGRIISSSLDIEEVYERFADEVRKLIPFDRILVNLVNQQEGIMSTAYTAGMEALGREKGVVIPIAGSVTEEMIRTGTPMLFRLESGEEVLDRFPGLLLGFQAGLRSRLSVPLIARGEVIGSLALASKQEKAYGERDIRLAQGVAGQIAGAIATAQLFRERKQAEEKIRASLREKELLLKEIHHRVKNNLQVVSSLLYLQSTRTKHPEAVSALRESRDRVKSMALIHERLYQSPNLAGVDMGKYMRNLVADLQHSYSAEDTSVRITLTVGDISLGITEAIPCGLIINELVSNALKHAFPKGATRVPVVAGELTIQLVKEGANQVTLTVSDNGIGFPEHVDFRQSPSLGLTLVNSLVEQLNGTIELDRREGTTFTIIFNVSG
jgi:PAS domain S-box-containing protein